MNEYDIESFKNIDNVLKPQLRKSIDTVLKEAKRHLSPKDFKEYSERFINNLKNFGFYSQSKETNPDLNNSPGYVDLESKEVVFRDDSINANSTDHELTHISTYAGKFKISDTKATETLGMLTWTYTNGQVTKIQGTGLNEGMAEYLGKESGVYNEQQNISRLLHFAIGDKMITSFLMGKPNVIKSELNSAVSSESFDEFNGFFDNFHNVDSGVEADKKHKNYSPEELLQNTYSIVNNYFLSKELQNLDTSKYKGSRGLNELSKKIAGFDALLSSCNNSEVNKNIKELFNNIKGKLNNEAIKNYVGRNVSEGKRNLYCEKLNQTQMMYKRAFKYKDKSFEFDKDMKYLKLPIDSKGSSFYLINDGIETSIEEKFNNSNRHGDDLIETQSLSIQHRDSIEDIRNVLHSPSRDSALNIVNIDLNNIPQGFQEYLEQYEPNSISMLKEKLKDSPKSQISYLVHPSQTNIDSYFLINNNADCELVKSVSKDNRNKDFQSVAIEQFTSPGFDEHKDSEIESLKGKLFNIAEKFSKSLGSTKPKSNNSHSQKEAR